MQKLHTRRDETLPALFSVAAETFSELFSLSRAERCCDCLRRAIQTVLGKSVISAGVDGNAVDGIYNFCRVCAYIHFRLFYNFARL